jgi:hypothetical protein
LTAPDAFDERTEYQLPYRVYRGADDGADYRHNETANQECSSAIFVGYGTFSYVSLIPNIGVCGDEHLPDNNQKHKLTDRSPSPTQYM